ncbi:hypothetical protein DICPUDRAFT_158541 [Dictyostelium purpureum]|uniref:Uncharacterized protein n=1 Tax=Dictyostelium purpureum TaxID=5786 RepID=F1A1V2_DICPU|nr:uncharacterized protein DICPUDRAFT_158541 [Dictyostelium purpureum]EGC29824.1 hypothetical protein DICPUDRAFT_158541 [Dictyostelium purpureum]|eukprot:XP_003293645.1 hypothetical protein DICPUDRAFT_158541 [Dictyostelium purpureum]
MSLLRNITSNIYEVRYINSNINNSFNNNIDQTIRNKISTSGSDTSYRSRCRWIGLYVF